MVARPRRRGPVDELPRKLYRRRIDLGWSLNRLHLVSGLSMATLVDGETGKRDLYVYTVRRWARPLGGQLDLMFDDEQITLDLETDYDLPSAA